MNDPLVVFDNWCSDFQNYLIPNHPNLMNNLIYFDQVLEYYRSNYILCEPYQQFTNKFLIQTIPNAISKMKDLPNLDVQIYEKILVIFAKCIDLSAMFIIRNMLFYKKYSFVVDDIYDSNSSFMINNKNGETDLSKMVKDHPYLNLIDWVQKQSNFDWDIFHYVVNYLFFISKYTLPNDSIKLFLTSILNLISQTLESAQIKLSYSFPLDMYKLIILISKTQFKQMYDPIIYFIVVCMMKSTSLLTVNELITVLVNFKKEKEFEVLINKALNDIQFHKLICSPTVPLELLEKGEYYLLKLDEDLIIKTLNYSSLQEDKEKRLIKIIRICYLSFQLLNQQQKVNFLEKFLKVEGNESHRLQLLSFFILLNEGDSIPNNIYDDIIQYFYKSGIGFELVVVHNITSNTTASRILLFLNNHSNDENTIKFLISFAKNNSKYFSILKDEDYRQVLLKDDYNSFNYYFQLVISGDHKLLVEDLKIIWNQIIAHDDRIPVLLKYFKRHFKFLFSTDTVQVFITLLVSLDYSKIGQNMIDLLVDFIYLQEKALVGNVLDKSIRIQNFNQFGMNELFQCYLNTANTSTLNYVKTQLLNIWNNCDLKVSAERNEVLSEIMIKYCSTEYQFNRCFNFLNNFVRSSDYIYLLEDFGFTHLKDQKDLIQNKTIKLTIVLKPFIQNLKETAKSSEILRGTMRFSPSDLCCQLQSRIQAKFRCKDIKSVKCYGRALNMNSTLEMDRITDGSIIEVEYVSIRNTFGEYQQLQIYMPQMLMNCVPIYQKALDLLHSKSLSKSLAVPILDFIYYLPISFQLLSLLDSVETISKAIDEALNPFERELYLHVLFKSLHDEKVTKMLIESQFYKNLIKAFNEKELNKAGNKRILSILTIIWPETENDEFCANLHEFVTKIINLMTCRNTKSEKLINNCCELILKINSFERYGKIVSDVIKGRIMDIINNAQLKIFGKIISQLQSKDEIFNMLIPHLDEFSNSDRCPFYFDAIFSSIDNETKNLNTLVDLALSKLYSFGTSAFYSLCEFIINRPDLFSRIDINQFFNYIELNDICPSVLKLINEIYQKVPDKRIEITNILNIYISAELPEYNIGDNYVFKKNPLGSGIRNLSNTCYISSAIQLLYNTNLFRVSLLKKNGLSNDWQIELQKLFAVKKFGLLPFVDPSDFVNNYKMMGEKINVAEQQDTAEFLLSIINGLPSELSSMFCGSLTNMVTGIDYTYCSSNNEKFFCLSLDVNGCESLETSLSRYNQSEIVNNYRVEGRDESITVKKTTMIQDLPPVLLIQLRRFVYDVKTFNKEKLNSYFSFPFSIDMSDYSVDKQKPDNYILTGFILHSGKADFGHFHYIGYNKKIKQWVDYNDSITFSYQISNLEKDAFGSNFKNSNDNSIMSNQSAYILVYEKVDQVNEIDLKENEISGLLRETIKAEQIKMKRISSVMSNDFYNLALNSLDIEFLYKYFTKIILHVNDIEKVSTVQNKLQNLLKGNKKGIQQVIEFIEKDKIRVVSPIIYIKNIMITHIWIDFLKYVIRCSENGDCYCFVNTMLRCIDVFKDNPDQANLFAEIGKEALKFPDSLIIAQSQKWQVTFLVTLASIVQNLIQTENYNCVNIDPILEVLILMAPIFEKEQKKLVESLGSFIVFFNQKTQNLYNTLSIALSSV